MSVSRLDHGAGATHLCRGLVPVREARVPVGVTASTRDFDMIHGGGHLTLATVTTNCRDSACRITAASMTSSRLKDAAISVNRIVASSVVPPCRSRSTVMARAMTSDRPGMRTAGRGERSAVVAWWSIGMYLSACDPTGRRCATDGPAGGWPGSGRYEGRDGLPMTSGDLPEPHLNQTLAAATISGRQPAGPNRTWLPPNRSPWPGAHDGSASWHSARRADAQRDVQYNLEIGMALRWSTRARRAWHQPSVGWLFGCGSSGVEGSDVLRQIAAAGGEPVPSDEARCQDRGAQVRLFWVIQRAVSMVSGPDPCHEDDAGLCHEVVDAIYLERPSAHRAVPVALVVEAFGPDLPSFWPTPSRGHCLEEAGDPFGVLGYPLGSVLRIGHLMVAFGRPFLVVLVCPGAKCVLEVAHEATLRLLSQDRPSRQNGLEDESAVGVKWSGVKKAWVGAPLVGTNGVRAEARPV